MASCVTTWIVSHFLIAGVTVVGHPYSLSAAIRFDAVEVTVHDLPPYRGGPTWRFGCTRASNSEFTGFMNYYEDAHVRFAGFAFKRMISAGLTSFRMPLWFLTVLSGGTWWLLWRARKQRIGGGFPVDLVDGIPAAGNDQTPCQEIGICSLMDKPNPSRP
jgi:hypothetical protein